MSVHNNQLGHSVIVWCLLSYNTISINTATVII